MNLSEVVTLFDNTYDFPDLKIQEDSMKDFDKVETADELVALYKTIDPDGPYVDRARQSAEAKMKKSFSKIFSSTDRTQYAQNRNRFSSLTTEIAGLRQQEANFREVFPQTELESDAKYQSRLESMGIEAARDVQGGSIITGTGDNKQELTYAQLNERIFNLDKEYLGLDQDIENFDYFLNNSLDYAIAQYDKKNNLDSQGDGSTSSVNEDETEKVISKVAIAEFEDLSPDAIETLTNLDISDFEGEFSEESITSLENLPGILSNIESALEADISGKAVKKDYVSSEVDKLMQIITDSGIDISDSDNNIIQLLNSIESIQGSTNMGVSGQENTVAAGGIADRDNLERRLEKVNRRLLGTPRPGNSGSKILPQARKRRLERRLAQPDEITIEDILELLRQ